MNKIYSMHYIYFPAAKLLYLITLFQKKYLKLNGDYFLSCGLLQPLTVHTRSTEKALQVTKVTPTLRRLHLSLEHNKHVYKTTLKALFTFVSS
jgi:hypothetical protein